MGRSIGRTTQRQRRLALEPLREALGDRLFADFVVHLLIENPGAPVTRYPALAALWLRGRALGIAGRRDEED